MAGIITPFHERVGERDGTLSIKPAESPERASLYQILALTVKRIAIRIISGMCRRMTSTKDVR